MRRACASRPRPARMRSRTWRMSPWWRIRLRNTPNIHSVWAAQISSCAWSPCRRRVANACVLACSQSCLSQTHRYGTSVIITLYDAKWLSMTSALSPRHMNAWIWPLGDVRKTADPSTCLTHQPARQGTSCTGLRSNCRSRSQVCCMRRASCIGRSATGGSGQASDTASRHRPGMARSAGMPFLTANARLIQRASDAHTCRN